MKSNTILSILLAVGAALGLGFVFVQNASPYLTIDQVKDSSKGVHVVGKIVPGSLEQRASSEGTRFRLKDDTGMMNVVYTGPSLSNLESASQVVVIGDQSRGGFTAKQMLVKCPSKYEGQKGPQPNKS